MDKKTRVLNAMDGKEVDHVPVGFWHHFAGKDEKGEGSVKAHLKFYHDADLDMIKIMSDGVWPVYPDEIKVPSDFAKVRSGGAKGSYVQDAVDRAKRINDELQGECCTFFNVFSPSTLLRMYVGWEKGFDFMQQDQAAFQSALNAIADDNRELAYRVITEGGCTGIYASVMAAEVDRFPAEVYEELIKPSDLPAIESANAVSNYNIVHLCGFAGIRNQLEIWKKYRWALQRNP
ncbi:MAG: uroporphyrinogen decarboxylase family protein [Eubacteriales bacterium]|nr:uroporphyrinogen decarboxylase family protein [Eubacteriales bacterium]